MDKLMLMNDQLNAVVWGKYMIFFLLFTGFWLMLRTRFLPFTHARLILRKTLGSLGKGDKGDGVTPFQAVATALAGTLGVGSVVAVSYTHLDVYKRQKESLRIRCRLPFPSSSRST